jgi:hypothetical protein
LDLMEMVKIINEFFPEKAVELSETLELLIDTMENTRQDIKKHMVLLFDEGKHEAMIPHNKLAAAILEYMAQVQEVQAALEPEEQVMVESSENDQTGLPDYQAYAVDTEAVHTLHEDFTYTRPAAFEFKDERVEVRTWQQMLVKTCEMLMDFDYERFSSFENDPTMKGRKQKLFSTNSANNRSPHKIKDSGIYVETNLSANAIRNLIIKMLQKYSLKTSDFKVFLRADYSSLH